MMLGYKHRPNPLNNPRKQYYWYSRIKIIYRLTLLHVCLCIFRYACTIDPNFFFLYECSVFYVIRKSIIIDMAVFFFFHWSLHCDCDKKKNTIIIIHKKKTHIVVMISIHSLGTREVRMETLITQWKSTNML